MTTETWIGIAASALTALAALPQVIKIIKHKKAEDISLPMFLVLLTGIALWILYGFLKEDYILVFANGLSFLINGAVTLLSIKYKK